VIKLYLLIWAGMLNFNTAITFSPLLGG